MNKEDIKKLLEENFSKLSSMSVKEYTLYRKWVDIRQNHPINQSNDFFDDITEYPELKLVKSNIWVPRNPEDYLKLEPMMVQATDKPTLKMWGYLRSFCSSAVWHPSPGRLLRYYVIDRVTEKILGVISIGSDFIGVGGRDEYIGWTIKNRLKDGSLRHTAMGSTIVPTQPFGFNYNGGKLIALLTASDVVQNEWKRRYKEELVGVTTTSLYGGASMYNRLSYWRKCKSTMGNISIEPSEDIYEVIKEWYKKLDIESYRKDMSGSHPKNRTLSSIYKLAGVKPPVNNAPRGVYWNELFVDTKDFLCRRIDKVTEKKYDNSVSALSDLWKSKYASKRIENLTKDGRFENPETQEVLFYEDMITQPWESIKKKYLKCEEV